MAMVRPSCDSSPSTVPPAHTDAPTPSGRFSPRWRDGDVLVALLVLWIASVVRVVGASVRHEVFGTEATLAFMSFVLVPCIFFRARPRRLAPGFGARPPLRLVKRDPVVVAEPRER
jgi:hypothetical protein